jgi:hypothetical protein
VPAADSSGSRSEGGKERGVRGRASQCLSDVWREALAIIRRYPLATLVPAVVLAALGDAPYYFLKDSGLGWEQILTFMTAALAYYLTPRRSRWKPKEVLLA